MTSTNSVSGQLSQPEVRRPDFARPGFRGQPAPENHPAQNVADIERLVGGFLGIALVYFGLKRHSLNGLLAAALGGGLVYRSSTGHCPVYEKLHIDTAGKTAARPEDYFDHGVHVEQSFMIQKPVAEVYNFWRNFENLPTFMTHLQSVEVLSPTRSRWTAKAPLGMQVSWEAEIIHDTPNEMISWKSVDHTMIANAGTIVFTPRGEQTEVRVILDYIPPAGVVGKVVAQLFGEEPSQSIKDDLRRFKQTLEAGEIAKTDGQAKGNCR